MASLVIQKTAGGSRPTISPVIRRGSKVRRATRWALQSRADHVNVDALRGHRKRLRPVTSLGGPRDVDASLPLRLTDLGWRSWSQFRHLGINSNRQSGARSQRGRACRLLSRNCVVLSRSPRVAVRRCGVPSSQPIPIPFSQMK